MRGGQDTGYPDAWGLVQRFVEAVGKPAGGEQGPLAFEEQPEVGRILKVAAEYGTEILLPIV